MRVIKLQSTEWEKRPGSCRLWARVLRE